MSKNPSNSATEFWQNIHSPTPGMQKYVDGLNDVPDSLKQNWHCRVLLYRPTVYAIVLNNKTNNKKYQLVKVGFTMLPMKNNQDNNDKEESDNRMQEVCSKIRKKLSTKDVSILFSIMIPTVYDKSFFHCEAECRQQFGIPIEKNSAKTMGLPIHTEWTLVPQEYINVLKKERIETRYTKLMSFDRPSLESIIITLQETKFTLNEVNGEMKLEQ